MRLSYAADNAVDNAAGNADEHIQWRTSGSRLGNAAGNADKRIQWRTAGRRPGNAAGNTAGNAAGNADELCSRQSFPLLHLRRWHKKAQH